MVLAFAPPLASSVAELAPLAKVSTPMVSDSLALLSDRIARPRGRVSPEKAPSAEFRKNAALSEMRSLGALSSLLSRRKVAPLLMVNDVTALRRPALPESWKSPELTTTEPVKAAVVLPVTLKLKVEPFTMRELVAPPVNTPA
jgi:hypothetical protein